MEAKNDQIIRTITEKKYPLIFVSPHLDDSILSAGGMIIELKKSNTLVNLTVFSRESDLPPSLSVKAFLRQCGYTDSHTFFKDRQQEDQAVFAGLGIPCQHLGFVDALWRPLPQPTSLQKSLGRFLPEFLYTYPTYRFHITKGKIAEEDNAILENIKRAIDTEIEKYPNAIIFCPLAVGNNVDHVIISEICKKNYDRVIFWSDLPYTFQCDAIGKSCDLHSFENDKNLNEKNQLIKQYHTQYHALFPSGQVPNHKEKFYYSQKLYQEIVEK